MNDGAYTLYISPQKKRYGRFTEGNIPWNKGMSWEEQGYTKERREKIIAQLRENSRKNTNRNRGNHFKHPVIQMDEYGNRLHWYESSEFAARKLGLQGRNIRRVCDGERNHCGGFRWRWDERFK